MAYEAVIGLETHAELLTETKMFCGCPTAFGAEPNTQTCPVCIGMPGVLPVVNEKAVEFGLLVALALHCDIPEVTRFDRKNYYYPDLPKNYQISQNYNCLGVGGYLEIEVDGQVKRVGMNNVHMEEDAGKLIHPEAADADYSLVDLNRAGTPLLEIVTEPDMRTPQELEAFMLEMRDLLLYLGVCDCKIQEGRLRFEVSVSVRPEGQTELGDRVEVKNVASIKAVVRAAEYEIKRQTKVLEQGGRVARETRLWDDELGRTEPMRSKEEAQDYRYFPEPDLPPIRLPRERLAELEAALPELPLARRRRFVNELGLSAYDAGVLTADQRVADWYEECLKLHDDPKTVCNWVINNVLRELNERGIGIDAFRVRPAGLAELLKLLADRQITNAHAKEVFAEMAETGRGAAAIVEERGLTQISDEGELLQIVRQVIEANPKPAQDVRDGKKKAIGFLMGQVMRATKGQADPKLVSRLFEQELSE